MICSPLASVSRVSPAARESGESSGTRSGSAHNRAFVHPVPPSDPLRQAGRLPIKVLKMLTARSGHILHPEYLQPLPSTPVSPIELDAKKSPLALLAQTCSQIGKPDPTPSKLSSVTGSSASDKEAKSGPLKLSDIGAEDKSSFKPYSKPPDKKEHAAGDKSGFRVPSAACPPFTPRTGSPSSPRTPQPSSEAKTTGESADKKETEQCAKSGQSEGSTHGRLSVDLPQTHPEGPGGCKSLSAAPSPTPVSSSSNSSGSVLGSGLVAPVSPYKPGHTVFPLPPAGMSYPGALSGAYAGYHPQFLHGVSLDHTKGNSLMGAQLSSLGCSSKSAASSPLTGASPPSVMTASLCRDPYCLSYHCTSQLGASATCGHDLKSGYPLVYPSHTLHGVSPPSLQGHPLYPYGFMLPNDPLPHVCNWVSATGPCDKRFSSSEELLGHLRTHTAFSGAADKLLPGYPSSSSLAAAAMACHMPPAGASPSHLTLRSPHHHPLGLSSSRYHPYSKSPLPSGGAPVPVPAATGHYYSPYALYGQRLTTASALGYQ